MAEKYKMADLLHEFNWTRSRHNGSIIAASEVLNVKPSSLERALDRARAAGHVVDFTPDHRRVNA